MALFSRRAAALAWNSKGECFGVLISKQGDKYQVVNHWTEKASGSSGGVAAILPQGLSALDASEDDIIIAGEMGMRCSFSDVKMPFIPIKDMQRSLSFSISSHFPIDPVDLHWAFRVVDEKDELGQAHVRLLALKNDSWDDWLDAVGSMKVDLLLSPASVADSVLNRPVFIPRKDTEKAKLMVKSNADGSNFIPSTKEDKGFLLSHNDEGLLSVNIVQESGLEDAFGTGSDPLFAENLDIDGMEDLPETVQKKFAQAILLALHGLTANLKREKETAFQLPKSMAPKRNVLTSTLCSALAIYILALGCFQLARYYKARSNDSKKIKAHISALNEDTKRSLIDPKRLEQLEQLKMEMEEKVYRPASPKDVLSEITRNLPKEYYLSNFQYRQDKVTCKVKTSDPAASSGRLFNIFKKVDFFEDDVEVDESTTGITLILKVQKPALQAEE